MRNPKLVLRGAIVLYFVIGLEVLIMISPAAGFFYAAFNPFLLSLARSPATRWLTAFFLPHMVSPPDPFLAVVRVAGSVLFVSGGVVFLLCAGQVYYHKFSGKGAALRGPYSWIRHPQYLGLGVAGIGLSILWPRFLVIALWGLMAMLYFLLAKDEERRMLAEFGDEYRRYMDRTGMFLPKGAEAGLAKLLPIRSFVVRAALLLLFLWAGTVGAAFALRSYTVARLPLWSDGSVTALAILPGDRKMMDLRMAAVLDLPEVRTRLAADQGPVLVYVMPVHYVMQGMIADTGGRWRLYKRRHTFAMISDWIFHPFRHLEGGSHGMQGDAGGGGEGMDRRLIFLDVEPSGQTPARPEPFGIDATRVPLFYADVDLHAPAVRQIRDLPRETGWGRVPTPIF